MERGNDQGGNYVILSGRKFYLSNRKRRPSESERFTPEEQYAPERGRRLTQPEIRYQPPPSANLEQEVPAQQQAPTQQLPGQQQTGPIQFAAPIEQQPAQPSGVLGRAREVAGSLEQGQGRRPVSEFSSAVSRQDMYNPLKLYGAQARGVLRPFLNMGLGFAQSLGETAGILVPSLVGKEKRDAQGNIVSYLPAVPKLVADKEKGRNSALEEFVTDLGQFGLAYMATGGLGNIPLVARGIGAASGAIGKVTGGVPVVGRLLTSGVISGAARESTRAAVATMGTWGMDDETFATQIETFNETTLKNSSIKIPVIQALVVGENDSPQMIFAKSVVENFVFDMATDVAVGGIGVAAAGNALGRASKRVKGIDNRFDVNQQQIDTLEGLLDNPEEAKRVNLDIPEARERLDALRQQRRDLNQEAEEALGDLQEKQDAFQEAQGTFDKAVKRVNKPEPTPKPEPTTPAADAPDTAPQTPQQQAASTSTDDPWEVKGTPQETVAKDAGTTPEPKAATETEPQAEDVLTDEQVRAVADPKKQEANQLQVERQLTSARVVTAAAKKSVAEQKRLIQPLLDKYNMLNSPKTTTKGSIADITEQLRKANSAIEAEERKLQGLRRKPKKTPLQEAAISNIERVSDDPVMKGSLQVKREEAKRLEELLENAKTDRTNLYEQIHGKKKGTPGEILRQREAALESAQKTQRDTEALLGRAKLTRKQAENVGKLQNTFESKRKGFGDAERARQKAVNAATEAKDKLANKLNDIKRGDQMARDGAIKGLDWENQRRRLVTESESLKTKADAVVEDLRIKEGDVQKASTALNNAQTARDKAVDNLLPKREATRQEPRPEPETSQADVEQTPRTEAQVEEEMTTPPTVKLVTDPPVRPTEATPVSTAQQLLPPARPGTAVPPEPGFQDPKVVAARQAYDDFVASPLARTNPERREELFQAYSDAINEFEYGQYAASRTRAAAVGAGEPPPAQGLDAAGSDTASTLGQLEVAQPDVQEGTVSGLVSATNEIVINNKVLTTPDIVPVTRELQWLNEPIRTSFAQGYRDYAAIAEEYARLAPGSELFGSLPLEVLEANARAIGETGVAQWLSKRAEEDLLLAAQGLRTSGNLGRYILANALYASGKFAKGIGGSRLIGYGIGMAPRVSGTILKAVADVLPPGPISETFRLLGEGAEALRYLEGGQGGAAGIFGELGASAVIGEVLEHVPFHQFFDGATADWVEVPFKALGNMAKPERLAAREGVQALWLRDSVRRAVFYNLVRARNLGSLAGRNTAGIILSGRAQFGAKLTRASAELIALTHEADVLARDAIINQGLLYSAAAREALSGHGAAIGKLIRSIHGPEAFDLIPLEQRLRPGTNSPYYSAGRFENLQVQEAGEVWPQIPGLPSAQQAKDLVREIFQPGKVEQLSEAMGWQDNIVPFVRKSAREIESENLRDAAQKVLDTRTKLEDAQRTLKNYEVETATIESDLVNFDADRQSRGIQDNLAQTDREVRLRQRLHLLKGSPSGDPALGKIGLIREQRNTVDRLQREANEAIEARNVLQEETGRYAALDPVIPSDRKAKPDAKWSKFWEFPAPVFEETSTAEALLEQAQLDLNGEGVFADLLEKFAVVWRAAKTSPKTALDTWTEAATAKILDVEAETLEVFYGIADAGERWAASSRFIGETIGALPSTVGEIKGRLVAQGRAALDEAGTSARELAMADRAKYRDLKKKWQTLQEEAPQYVRALQVLFARWARGDLAKRFGDEALGEIPPGAAGAIEAENLADDIADALQGDPTPPPVKTKPKKTDSAWELALSENEDLMKRKDPTKGDTSAKRDLEDQSKPSGTRWEYMKIGRKVYETYRHDNGTLSYKVNDKWTWKKPKGKTTIVKPPEQITAEGAKEYQFQMMRNELNEWRKFLGMAATFRARQGAEILSGEMDEVSELFLDMWNLFTEGRKRMGAWAFKDGNAAVKELDTTVKGPVALYDADVLGALADAGASNEFINQIDDLVQQVGNALRVLGTPQGVNDSKVLNALSSAVKLKAAIDGVVLRKGARETIESTLNPIIQGLELELGRNLTPLQKATQPDLADYLKRAKDGLTKLMAKDAEDNVYTFADLLIRQSDNAILDVDRYSVVAATEGIPRIFVEGIGSVVTRAERFIRKRAKSDPAAAASLADQLRRLGTGIRNLGKSSEQAIDAFKKGYAEESAAIMQEQMEGIQDTAKAIEQQLDPGVEKPRGEGFGEKLKGLWNNVTNRWRSKDEKAPEIFREEAEHSVAELKQGTEGINKESVDTMEAGQRAREDAPPPEDVSPDPPGSEFQPYPDNVPESGGQPGIPGIGGGSPLPQNRKRQTGRQLDLDVATENTKTVNKGAQSPGAVETSQTMRQQADPSPSNNLPIDSIQVDAKTFQFKDTLNRGGRVYESTASQANKFIPQISGPIQVWRDVNNSLGRGDVVYVVNGHNRLDLAKRSNPKPETIEVSYLEAGNAQEAMAWGALKNISERNGTDIDAAKVLREADQLTDEFKDAAANIHGPLMQNAVPLTRLSKNLFTKVIDGNLDKAKAYALGARELDPKIIDGIYDLSVQYKWNSEEISQAIWEAGKDLKKVSTDGRQANLLAGTDQADLFTKADLGDLPFRVASRAAVSKALKEEVTSFRGVAKTKTAQKVQTVKGNVIDQEASAKRFKESQVISSIFNKSASSSEEVRTIINEMVEAVKVNNPNYAPGKTVMVPGNVRDKYMERLRTALVKEAKGLKLLPSDAADTPIAQAAAKADQDAVAKKASKAKTPEPEPEPEPEAKAPEQPVDETQNKIDALLETIRIKKVESNELGIQAGSVYDRYKAIESDKTISNEGRVKLLTDLMNEQEEIERGLKSREREINKLYDEVNALKGPGTGGETTQKIDDLVLGTTYDYSRVRVADTGKMGIYNRENDPEWKAYNETPKAKALQKKIDSAKASLKKELEGKNREKFVKSARTRLGKANNAMKDYRDQFDQTQTEMYKSMQSGGEVEVSPETMQATAQSRATTGDTSGPTVQTKTKAPGTLPTEPDNSDEIMRSFSKNEREIDKQMNIAARSNEQLSELERREAAIARDKSLPQQEKDKLLNDIEKEKTRFTDEGNVAKEQLIVLREENTTQLQALKNIQEDNPDAFILSDSERADISNRISELERQRGVDYREEIDFLQERLNSDSRARNIKRRQGDAEGQAGDIENFFDAEGNPPLTGGGQDLGGIGMPFGERIREALRSIKRVGMKALSLPDRLRIGQLFQMMDDTGAWTRNDTGMNPVLVRELRDAAPNTVSLQEVGVIRGEARKVDQALAEVSSQLEDQLDSRQLGILRDAMNITQRMDSVSAAVLRQSAQNILSDMSPKQAELINQLLVKESDLQDASRALVQANDSILGRTIEPQGAAPTPEPEVFDSAERLIGDLAGADVDARRGQILQERTDMEIEIARGDYKGQDKKNMQAHLQGLDFELDELERLQREALQSNSIGGVTLGMARQVLRQVRRTGFNALHMDFRDAVVDLLRQTKDIGTRIGRKAEGIEHHLDAADDVNQPMSPGEINLQVAEEFGKLLDSNREGLASGKLRAEDLLREASNNLATKTGKPLMAPMPQDMVATQAAFRKAIGGRVDDGIERMTDGELQRQTLDYINQHGMDPYLAADNLRPTIQNLGRENMTALRAAQLTLDYTTMKLATAADIVRNMDIKNVPIARRVQAYQSLISYLHAHRYLTLSYRSTLSRAGSMLRIPNIKRGAPDMSRPYSTRGAAAAVDQVDPSVGRAADAVDDPGQAFSVAETLKQDIQSEAAQGTLGDVLGQKISPELAQVMNDLETKGTASLASEEIRNELDKLAAFAKDLAIAPDAPTSIWSQIQDAGRLSVDGLLFLRLSNLLSAGSTFWVNTISGISRVLSMPLVQTGGVPIQNMAEAIAQRSAAPIGRIPRDMMLALEQYVAMGKQMRDAFRLAGHSAKHGIGLWDPESMALESMDKLAKRVAGGKGVEIRPDRWNVNNIPQELQPNSEFMRHVTTGLWRTFTMPMRLIIATDTFVKSLGGNSNHWIRRYAEELELADKRGLKGMERNRAASAAATERLNNELKDVILNPDDPNNIQVIPRAAMMNQHALNYSRQATFTDNIWAQPEFRTTDTAQRVARRRGLEPGSEEYESFIRKYLGQNDGMAFSSALMPRAVSLVPAGINNLKNSPIGPLVSLIAPFVKTPGDIIKSALRHTPAAVFVDTWWRDALSQDIFTRQRALGEIAVGSAAVGTTMFYWDTLQDKIQFTGGGPMQLDHRNKWMEQEGKRPFSYRFRNPDGSWGRWRSYRSFEPLATSIGMMADWKEMQGAMTEEQRNRSSMIMILDISARASQGMLGKTWWQGFEEMFTALESVGKHGIAPPNRRDPILRFFTRQAMTFMPLSSALRRAQRDIDPTVRIVEPSNFGGELWDEFKKQVPGGWSNQSPPLLNVITGDTVTIGGDIGLNRLRDRNDVGWLTGVGYGMRQFLPTSASEEWQTRNDPVLAEMGSLKGPGTRFTVPSRNRFVKRSGTRKSTMLQSEWNEWVYYRTQKPNPLHGNMTLHERLSLLISSEGYQNLPPPLQSDRGPSMQAQMINAILADYDSEADEAFLKSEAGKRIAQEIEDNKAIVTQEQIINNLRIRPDANPKQDRARVLELLRTTTGNRP